MTPRKSKKPRPLNEEKTHLTTIEQDVSLFTDFDLYLFNEGNHHKLYEKLGAHLLEKNGIPGTYFAVWAPNARDVSVMGDFNGWNRTSHHLQPREKSGIWEGFIKAINAGSLYKYLIVSQYHDYTVEKADPFAFFSETPPKTASIPEGGAVPGVHGRNTGGKNVYTGPCPPYGEHRYFFKLYALDKELSLTAGATKGEVERAMKGHVLAEASLMGRYEKKNKAK